MSDEVLVSAEEGLLRVTLNRPAKRNPLSRANSTTWAAARKLGMARGETGARDRELFAQAWCHADHWHAAANVLKKESTK